MHGDKPDPGNLGGLGRSLRKVIGGLGSPQSAPGDRSPGSSRWSDPDSIHILQTELELQREELRRTKLALESSRARYFELLEYTSGLYNQAPVGYLTLTDEGKIVEANRTATQLFGTGRAHLLQQRMTRFMADEEHGLFHAYCDRLLATRQLQRCELRMLRADGTPFFAQMDAALIRDAAGIDTAEAELRGRAHRTGRPRIRLTIIDISQRVQLEENERNIRRQLEGALTELHATQAEMVQQERLAVVGQLAAGIAHDFNNILAVITLYAQLLLRATDLPSHLRPRMEAIGVQTQRATHLVQQILDFSRRSVVNRQATGLIHYLEQFAELLQTTLPEAIQVRLDVGALRAEVDDVADIDPTRIHQVLLNLAGNARDAMPAGGELRVTLSRLAADSPTSTPDPLPQGAWLCIAVSDTGTGIDPKHLPHLFEPFFTTKEVGAGSGLGLAQVWGIVKQHGGEIGVTSQMGRGTTFSLYLPALAEAPATPVPSERETIPYGHGEVVLVVEDIGVLRTALMSTLEQLGYQVLEATNGEDAVRLVLRERERISLILSDLVMPVMSGEELIQSLRAQGWQQPVVVLSGYPLTPDKVEELYRYGQVSWLLKPPDLAQLAHLLDQALHPRPTAAV